MNIVSKLTEQLAVLENLQTLATSGRQFSTALDISRTILDYVIRIDNMTDEDEFICEDCQEAEMKAMLHQDIADACDLPIELVNRVLAGQDEVLGME
ncbi:MAG TPA: hypothetical protein DCX03_00880 [Bacteroidales bacterium]|jgi:hypothetical protein|nr:hypothetical protein [Bacteroidales bacterium]